MAISITAAIDPARSRVEARTASGMVIDLDGDPPEGDGEAPGPMETLLAALAGCTAMDVASILRKKRQSVEHYEISVEGESAGEHPRVFTTIRVEHRVRGEVSREALRRSIELSATRYCPVSATLSALATIEHHYRLVDEGGVEHEALVAVTGPTGTRVV
jgi:putative redox protein